MVIPIQLIALSVSIVLGLISFIVTILVKSLNSNTKAIQNLEIMMAEFKTTQIQADKSKASTEETLRDHGVTLVDHEKRIIKLER